MPTSPTLAAKILAELDEHTDPRIGEIVTSADGLSTAIRHVVIAHLVQAEQGTVIDAVLEGAAGTDPQLLSILGEVAASLEILAENTGHAETTLTQAQVEKAWADTGERTPQYIADAFLARLGITVDA